MVISLNPLFRYRFAVFTKSPEAPKSPKAPKGATGKHCTLIQCIQGEGWGIGREVNIDFTYNF